jgi:hypothetical protein
MSKYQQLFTTAGSDKLNIVNFFAEMSHGKLDMSANKVFGPYTLDAKLSNYGNYPPGATPPGKVNRIDLINLAKSAATAAGVNLSSFSGVCVSCLGAVDLFGVLGGMAMVCDTNSLDVSGPPQEFMHGYGLMHSKIYGSTAEYRDPWDVMSNYNIYESSNPDFTVVGPGLNAWNMRWLGWLNETRVWTTPTNAWDEVVQLRPLHRTDLEGFLAAQVGPYLVEFRVPQRWDTAIPRACVQVHSNTDNYSVLHPAYSGSRDIVQGDKFVFGDPSDTEFTGYYAVEVTKIDEPNLTATVKLNQRSPHPHRNPVLVGEAFGGVQVDGGGIVIIGGILIKVPPRGPVRELVENLARYLRADFSRNNVAAALAGQRAALEGIVSNVLALYSEAEELTERPPGYSKLRDPSPKTK